MTTWSTSWKASTQRRKQRKYRYNAPLHIKRKLASAHLSRDLRQKHKRRSITVRSGDRVTVLRGNHKGHKGKIDKVLLQLGKVVISGIELQKKDGNKARVAIDTSNIMITELKLDDKKRMRNA